MKTVPQPVQMIVRKRDGDMVMGKPEGLMNLSTDLYVVLLVVFVVAMATVSLIALVRAGEGKLRWTQYVAIGFAAVAVLSSCLIVVLVVLVAGSAVLFWPQIRDFDYGAVASIAVSAVLAIVGGGAVGLWMFRKKK